MTRSFPFATWQGGGNVMPELALAKRLARRGHDVPHLYEQALNGLRVSQLGAGKLVPAEADAAQIRASVVEVLGDPSFGSGAEQDSGWFEDGSEGAVAALEALADGS